MTDSCQATSNIRHSASQKSFKAKCSETHIFSNQRSDLAETETRVLILRALESPNNIKFRAPERIHGKTYALYREGLGTGDLEKTLDRFT